MTEYRIESYESWDEVIKAIKEGDSMTPSIFDVEETTVYIFNKALSTPEHNKVMSDIMGRHEIIDDSLVVVAGKDGEDNK